MKAARPKTIVVIVPVEDGDSDDSRAEKEYGVLLVRLSLVAWGAMVHTRLRLGLGSTKGIESNTMDSVKVVVHFLRDYVLFIFCMRTENVQRR